MPPKTRTSTRSLPSWSICAGEPLADLALHRQLPGRGGLPAILGELLETKERAGQDGHPDHGLQGGGSQIVLELEARVGQLQPARSLVALQRLGGQGRGEPAREHQDPRGQQPEDGGKRQGPAGGLKRPEGSGQAAQHDKDDRPRA